jgi:hypothetical protein
MADRPATAVDGWIEHDGTVSPCGTCNRVVGA